VQARLTPPLKIIKKRLIWGLTIERSIDSVLPDGEIGTETTKGNEMISKLQAMFGVSENEAKRIIESATKRNNKSAENFASIMRKVESGNAKVFGNFIY
jgi:hypothetical protein